MSRACEAHPYSATGHDGVSECDTGSSVRRDIAQKCDVASGPSQCTITVFAQASALIRELTMLCPQGVKGPWKAGIILDWHTVASQVIGENEFGHPIFDTQRSEIGELLYRFKYRSDRAALTKLRVVTRCIAQGVAAGLGVSYSDTALMKLRNTSALKSVVDPDVRRELLRDAFRVDKKQVAGKKVLLVDDVFRSGATLESAAEAVTAQGSPTAVYVLAMTRTRVNR